MDEEIRIPPNHEPTGAFRWNRPIKRPNVNFVKSHLTDIRLEAIKEFDKYIVHENSGPNDSGWRFGTQDEFEAELEIRRKIVDGSAESHNTCAERLRDKGGNAPMLDVEELLLPARTK